MYSEGAFSKGGDTDAVVLNIQRVVGSRAAFAGSQRKNVSYFTHAVELVESIKAVTGAMAVRVMGSPFSL